MKIVALSFLFTVALLIGQCELYRRTIEAMRVRYAEDATESREDIRRLTKMVRTLDQSHCATANTPALLGAIRDNVYSGDWLPALNSDTCDPKRMMAKGDGKISYHCSESGKWVQAPEK